MMCKKLGRSAFRLLDWNIFMPVLRRRPPSSACDWDRVVLLGRAGRHAARPLWLLWWGGSSCPATSTANSWRSRGRSRASQRNKPLKYRIKFLSKGLCDCGILVTDICSAEEPTCDEEVGNLPDHVHSHARQEEVHEWCPLIPRLDGWRLDQLPPGTNYFYQTKLRNKSSKFLTNLLKQCLVSFKTRYVTLHT